MIKIEINERSLERQIHELSERDDVATVAYYLLQSRLCLSDNPNEGDATLLKLTRGRMHSVESTVKILGLPAEDSLRPSDEGCAGYFKRMHCETEERKRRWFLLNLAIKICYLHQRIAGVPKAQINTQIIEGFLLEYLGNPASALAAIREAFDLDPEKVEIREQWAKVAKLLDSMLGYNLLSA